MHRRRASWLIATCCLLFGTAAVNAQGVIRQGGEFQVNKYTTNDQYHAAVAVDADGDFVVTWSSGTQDSPGTPGIFAARFDSAGERLGGELQINAFTVGIQDFSSVASEGNGDFVVVWQSYQDGNLTGIFGRRFASDGIPVGIEFQVNSYTSNFQTQAEVASDSDGDFVVVWRSSLQDGAGFGVFGQHFDSSGTPLAEEFQVSTYSVFNQSNPAVALEASGDFVIAWENDGIDGSGNAVMVRRFSSSGGAMGGDFRANLFTINNQARPAVATDADGDFVVTWQSLHQDGPLPYGNYGVFARSFNSSGTALGGEFQVNVYTTDYQRNPDIAADDSGDFVITWESRLQDGSSMGVFARRFNRLGAPQSPEIQANSYTVQSQGDTPAVDFDGDGDFVITWRTTEPQDGDMFGVFAQRFKLPPLATIDVDGNGLVEAFSDGLLIVKHLVGLSGANLVSGNLVGMGCSRCDAMEIGAYIDSIEPQLDVDANGSVDTFADGLLILKHLIGLTGANLVSGNLIDMANCTPPRCDATGVASYIDTLMTPVP